MTDLKPCPFCGGKAQYNPRRHGGCNWVAVKCTRCFVEGKEYASSVDYCAKDRAMEFWNRRADNE